MTTIKALAIYSAIALPVILINVLLDIYLGWDMDFLAGQICGSVLTYIIFRDDIRS